MSRGTQNLVAFATGVTGSGKSHLLHTLGRRFPRRLVFDSVAELDDIPNAITARTLGQAIDALKRASKLPRWTIVGALSPNDSIALIRAIAPHDRDPRETFTYRVGGIVVEHGEIDQIAPNNAGIDPAIHNMIARGRHYGISALIGSRRPSECHKMFRSQSHVIAAFTQHEPDDIDYLSRIPGAKEIERYLAMLRQYEYVRILTRSRRLEVIDRHGRPRRMAELA